VTRSILALIAFAAGSLALAAPTATEVRELGAFDEVLWDAAGELIVEQSPRSRLSIEAEPAVLAKVVAEVSARRLRIAFAPGPIQTRHPIRFRLETAQLLAFETRGSGAVRIAALSTPQLSLLLSGSGDIHLAELNAACCCTEATRRSRSRSPARARSGRPPSRRKRYTSAASLLPKDYG